MRIVILVALGMLIAGTVEAQYFVVPNRPIDSTPSRNSTGDPNLDRAIAICDAHQVIPFMVTVPNTPSWDSEYAGCPAVLEKWNASEVARRQAEAKRIEKADRAWLAEYAKGLRP